ncbi:Blp family class II bacteriocin [Streptococcus devriesei]|uniref:Blp family class II bacteriocin n=1 Tax=Streptococcus devriesei TaxID=231233 RepID=UPI00041B1153|nr:Blp family class II bacteriocin [Streptococcus devriesei]
MNTQAFEQFETLDVDMLSRIDGGGTGACLASAATALGLGAAAIGSSVVPAAAMYLGAQAFATAANYHYCTH